MEIFYQIDFNKIKEYIFKVAPYQKVVFCYDVSTPNEVFERIVEDNKSQTIFLEYNLEDLQSLDDVIDESVRLVLSCVNDVNFEKLKRTLTTTTFLIDLYYGNFVSYRLLENSGIIFLLNKEFDYTTEFLIHANLLIETKFYDILSYKNYGYADEKLDEIIDHLSNKLPLSSYRFSHKESCLALSLIESFVTSNNINEINMFLYAIVVCYKYLFLSIKNNNFILADIYKDYINDYENLNIAYEILTSERLAYVLKNYADTMLQSINKILNNINKLNLNFNSKINNLLKILKNKCKIIKKDNLLKISYLYGVFNSI